MHGGGFEPTMFIWTMMLEINALDRSAIHASDILDAKKIFTGSGNRTRDSHLRNGS